MSDSIICSFLVSDLSNLLTIAHAFWATWAKPEQFAHFAQKEWANLMLFLKKTAKKLEKLQKYDFLEWIAHFLWANEKISDLLKKTERFAHLLICPKRPEWIAHIRSFDLSNLSEWANERWAHEQIPNPVNWYWNLFYRFHQKAVKTKTVTKMLSSLSLWAEWFRCIFNELTVDALT